MQEVNGKERDLQHILVQTYTIHYYQREYRWQEKQIREMIDDLVTEFLDNYEPGHERKKIFSYGTYFMGSVVIAEKDKAIIDGQQRLTSLILLLMYLNNRIGHDQTVENMICTNFCGDKIYSINVHERQACMDAIYNDKLADFDRTNADESVQNLCDRYDDIVNLFPQDKITDNILLNFCDWLAYRVFFIEIIAETEQDAHKFLSR